jgi:hypothetical protein
MDVNADIIQPSWILVFCKNPGRWWVRLLAWGRYHHVKAIAHLPRMRGWLIYDVKFNGTRLMFAHEDDPATGAFLRDYLDNTDTIAMPRVPMPRRRFPQLGFWCTIAMRHLVGIRSRALRPDRLWRDCVAAGGRPCRAITESRGLLVRTLRARIRLPRPGTGATAPPRRAVIPLIS